MEKFTIGLDIGGTLIKGALFDAGANPVKKASVPTASGNAEEAFIATIESLVKTLQKDHRPAASVGIGIAGLIDADRKSLIESPNLPHLKKLALKKILEARLGLSVFIENDANAAALGELWAGAGKDLPNFLLFTLGTGIGSGLVLNGKLWTGETGKAGEWGHVVVQPDGAMCACGKKGCLEAHSSGTALVRMAKDALTGGRKTSLRSRYQQSPDTVTPEAIYNEAKNGDALCREIYFSAARYLAIALSNANNLLDIHTFIIGGGISRAFPLFETYLLEETRKRVFDISKKRIHITVSQLGNDAGTYGAAYLARNTCPGP